MCFIFRQFIISITAEAYLGVSDENIGPWTVDFLSFSTQIPGLLVP